MVLLITVRRSERPVSFAEVAWRTWVAALVLAASSMLYILALSRTSAATTLFMLAAAPVSAAIIGWMLLRERVDRSTITAIAITAVGVTIVMGAGLDAGCPMGLFFAALIPVLVGLYNLGHRSVTAARIPLLLRTEVVLAPLWVWIWPGETPVVMTLIGGAVIMSAVAWLMLRARTSDLPRPVIAAT